MVTELGGGWGGGCNRVHLHIVFVLLYSVCHFVSDSSFFFLLGVWEVDYDGHLFVIVLLRIIILDVSERAREKARGNKNGLSYVPSKRKE